MSCRYFNAVSIGVKRDALVVAVSGSSWAIHNGKSIVPKSLREFVDKRFGARRDGEVRQAHALSACFNDQRGKDRCAHGFNACTVSEAEKARREALGRVDVVFSSDCAEVGDVEALAPFKV